LLDFPNENGVDGVVFFKKKTSKHNTIGTIELLITHSSL
jgi:hypothetical protein